MTIDPTALAILSIFGGAALTAFAGLIGASINARREHSRWVREQRISVYERALGLLEEVRYRERDRVQHEDFRSTLTASAGQRGLGGEAREAFVRNGLRAVGGDRFSAEESLKWSRGIVARKIEIQASLSLLGSSTVNSRFDDAFGPLADKDHEAYTHALKSLEDAMRDALRIKNQ